jgi:hypothetical protein
MVSAIFFDVAEIRMSQSCKGICWRTQNIFRSSKLSKLSFKRTVPTKQAFSGCLSYVVPATSLLKVMAWNLSICNKRKVTSIVMWETPKWMKIEIKNLVRETTS